MLMNVFYVGCLVFGGLALAAVPFGVRSLLKDFSTPLKQPDGSSGNQGLDVPPTVDSVVGTSAPSGPAVRPRSRVMLGDPRLLSTTLASGWRFR